MLKKDRYRGNTFFKNPEYLDAIVRLNLVARGINNWYNKTWKVVRMVGWLDKNAGSYNTIIFVCKHTITGIEWNG